MSDFQENGAADESNVADRRSWWAFLDLLPNPVLVLGNDLVPVHCNPAFTELFGWNSSEIRNRPLLSDLDEQVGEVSRPLGRLKQDRVKRGIPAQWTTRAGSKLEVALDAVQLFDARQAAAGIVLSIRVLAYEPRDQRSRQILMRMFKEPVLVHLSHELKTPLSVLSASLQLFRRKRSASNDNSWDRIYERAQRNLQRLLEMAYAVEDILGSRDDAAFDMMNPIPQEQPQNTEPEKAELFFQQVNIEFLIHELKDPLSVIESNAYLLEDVHRSGKIPAKRQMGALKRILRGAKRVRLLLEELLEVGRAEAVCFNCIPFEPVKVVRQVLIDVVESHAPDLYDKARSFDNTSAQMKSLASNGIRFETQPSIDSLIMVQDETKFRQIVANLLKNAMTYRRNLLLIHAAFHKGVLTLLVRDDGPGVAKEHQEKIFERYTQVSPYPGIARSGHGLGLAVSRILARSMDGDILIESQLGQGAVFRLTLPITHRSGLKTFNRAQNQGGRQI